MWQKNEHLSPVLGFIPQLETTAIWTNFTNQSTWDDFLITEKNPLTETNFKYLKPLGFFRTPLARDEKTEEALRGMEGAGCGGLEGSPGAPCRCQPLHLVGDAGQEEEEATAGHVTDKHSNAWR